MADWREFTAKTAVEAIAEASLIFGVAEDQLEVEVVDEGKSGFLSIGARPAVIKARKKMTDLDFGLEFLRSVLSEMGVPAEVTGAWNAQDECFDINMEGEDVGILIGKRGQTLDSLQYLTSLVINKHREEYARVKLDTENYRARRKETLESLAHSVAGRVRRTRREVALEPMNPYERRIIHFALQDDRNVTTRSEGEEPFRHVVISLKKDGGSADTGRRGYGHYDFRSHK